MNDKQDWWGIGAVVFVVLSIWIALIWAAASSIAGLAR